MWLSRQSRQPSRWDSPAELGTVTLGGNPAGVYLSGERRNLPVIAPGGYYWRPAAGQQVLVLKAGTDGELPCVAGVHTSNCPETLQAGDLLLTTGKASVRIGADGSLDLRGKLLLNGTPIEDLFEQKTNQTGTEML